MKEVLISKGMNRKLAKHVGVFNLPQGTTCPGKTRLCAEVCYAKKSQRMYKSARLKRESNLVQSRQKGFAARMIKEITTRKFTHVRFHESGDAYNQPYLDKLFEVCRSKPDVRFLMYTKSFHLNWVDRPANLIVYWSVDCTSNAGTLPAQGLRAYTVAKGEKIPLLGYTTCVHVAAQNYCAGECSICWVGVSNVYFPQH
jgi:hypothetical protein